MKTVIRKAKMLALFFAVTAALAYATVALDLIGLNRRQFSSEEWRAGDARARGQMAQNLISSNVLKGMRRSEVLKVLGPSELHPFLSSLVYTVDQGPDWLLQPQKREVVVRFDKETLVWCVTIEPPRPGRS